MPAVGRPLRDPRPYTRDGRIDRCHHERARECLHKVEPGLHVRNAAAPARDTGTHHAIADAGAHHLMGICSAASSSTRGGDICSGTASTCNEPAFDHCAWRTTGWIPLGAARRWRASCRGQCLRPRPVHERGRLRSPSPPASSSRRRSPSGADPQSHRRNRLRRQMGRMGRLSAV